MRNKVILLDEVKTYIGSYPTYVDAIIKMQELGIEKSYYNVFSNGQVMSLHHKHVTEDEKFKQLHKYPIMTYIDVEDNDGSCYTMQKFFCKSVEDLHKIKTICYYSDIEQLEQEIDFAYFC